MTSPAPEASPRAVELRARLAQVRERIAAACAAAGRPATEVTLVAITKTHPAEDVRLLAGLGVTHVGENRDQEARPKALACSDLPLTWHFVGQLQRNKAISVAQYAQIVESVDRTALVGALDRAADRSGGRLGVCVQVDLDEEPGPADAPHLRGGARPDAAVELADAVAATAHLDLLGVMAVAPLGADPAAAFARLAATHEAVLAHHPQARMRSAGMSADLEAAVAAGATHVRLGSALLGPRSDLK